MFSDYKASVPINTNSVTPIIEQTNSTFKILQDILNFVQTQTT